MKTIGLFMATLAVAYGAVERATFDSAGGLTSLIDNGAELRVHGGLMAHFEGGLRHSLQPHDQRTPIARDGLNTQWTGTVTFPNSSQAKYVAAWSHLPNGEVALNASVSTETPLEVASLEYVLDLRRADFVGGSVEQLGLSEQKPADPTFYRANVDRLTVVAPEQRWTVSVFLDRARDVTVTDSWDHQGRFYRVRIPLPSGFLAQGTKLDFGLRLQLTAKPQPAPARLQVNFDRTLYRFDGFGGNYCWPMESPLVEYTLDQLRSAWSRLELKAVLWDRQRSAPGPQLVRDFEIAQRIQRSGIPWIISIWRLPERLYSDANQKPFSAFARPVHPDRWPELLDLIGSYLLYLKQHYGAEPDLFSFNEPDLGVNVGFSADDHREMVKRIGAHLKSLGLKTKMLLGDAANPRDTHRYILSTAADPEAMRYVGAISFHSWGSGTPDQYRAWGDASVWLGVPMIVGEAGVDPSSYRNRMFDSYAYGLREAEQYQELLRYARPATLLFWQYTEDYGLARVKADKSIEPTGRFWLMKQFSNLTPLHSQAVETSSDHREVLVSGFRGKTEDAIHIVNMGPARDVSVAGLSGTGWRAVTTTETEGFVETALPGTPDQLRLPARSMTTLVRGK
jgi:hypothetical protein